MNIYQCHWSPTRKETFLCSACLELFLARSSLFKLTMAYYWLLHFLQATTSQNVFTHKFDLTQLLQRSASVIINRFWQPASSFNPNLFGHKHFTPVRTIEKLINSVIPSRQGNIQKTYKRHSSLNIQKTSNLSSAREPQKTFNFEPSLKVQIWMFNVSTYQLQKTRKYWFTM